MNESNFWSLLPRVCVVVFVFSALRNAEVSSDILSERPDFVFTRGIFFVYQVLVARAPILLFKRMIS